MAIIKAFKALRPKQELAEKIASRPYDVLDSAEARVEAKGNDYSFLRINNLTLGYSLPSDLLKKIKLSRFRAFATVNNLATLTKYTGYDPEVNTRRSDPLTQGVDFAGYPRAKTWVFGVNLTF